MKRLTTLLLVITACSLCLAQRGRRYREAVEPGPQVLLDRRGVPDWPLDEEFPEDVFTFVRVMYNPYGGWGWGKWQTDYPDSDLNFSFRLQQLTSLKVNPNPVVLELTDPRLFDYPFLYIIEPGSGMGLTPEEADSLRRYCFNGGFVMVDDFWGEDEWYNFYVDLKKVFPDREPVDLTLDHAVFHCVYDLQEMPQIPSIGHALSGQTTERWDAPHANYRAIYDDNDRMVMLICHNTDLGDGWEREGENEDYFHQYSEKWAYPMGINIVFYAMSH